MNETIRLQQLGIDHQYKLNEELETKLQETEVKVEQLSQDARQR